MSNVSYYTQEGLDKLKNELRELQTKGRADIARQIAEARDKGDLSENAEYDAAKDAQGHLRDMDALDASTAFAVRLRSRSIFQQSGLRHHGDSDHLVRHGNHIVWLGRPCHSHRRWRTKHWCSTSAARRKRATDRRKSLPRPHPKGCQDT